MDSGASCWRRAAINVRAALRGERPWLVVGAILAAVALAAAAAYAWTCDDAFISYRYAENLVDGRGLVFNDGERVEGFTNLLWTLWIAFGAAFGAGAETWSRVWGALAYATLVAVLLALHIRLRRAAEAGKLAFPFAALGALAMAEMNSYATSGLETSLFSALVVLGFAFLVWRDEPSPSRAGFVLALATLTRPDGVIFAALGGAFVLWVSTRRIRASLIYSAAFAVVWVPATIWRVAYYGDFFPNTYYAKSAALAWYDQGFVYLSLFFGQYWPLLLALPLALVAALLGRVPDDATTAGHRTFVKFAALASVFAFSYAFYILRLGGDFMHARMLIPAVPFFLLLIDAALTRASLRLPGVALALGVVMLGALRFSPSPLTGMNKKFGIANERLFYSPEVVDHLESRATTIARFVAGLPVRIAFIGGEARLAYRTRVPVAIECLTGLTDRFIARQPLLVRGEVGSEKHAPLTYLIERKVHLLTAPTTDKLFHLGELVPAWPISFDGHSGFVVHWDASVMAELRRRGASFPDFIDALDRYIAGMRDFAREDVERAFQKFRRFYFDHVSDPERKAAFKRRIAEGR